MANENKTTYSATIAWASKELSKREQLKMLDTTGAIKLDKATEDAENGEVIVTPAVLVELDVHNEKAQGRDKDYKNYVVADKDGKTYVTGSASFWKSLREIDAIMDGEEYSVRVYRVPSKNYAGKEFISCTII